jgi:hypothetical protein
MARRLSSAISRSRSSTRINPNLRFVLLAGICLMLISALPWAAYGRQGETSDLVGEYTVIISRDDIPLSLIGGPGLVGDWHIVFAPDGTYSASRLDLGSMVYGTYAVDGQTMTVTDEAGLLSCSNPQPNGAPALTATYSWELLGARLQLEAIEESCATREILFTTRALSIYVACLTPSLGATSGNADLPAARDEAEARAEESVTPAAARDPNAIFPGVPEATPVPSDRATPTAGTPASGTPVSGTPAPEEEFVEIATQEDATEAIDELLAQMTACWATGDPVRVIPLFSPLLIEELTGGGAVEIADVVAALLPIQTLSITWERSGDVVFTNDDETEAEAVVTLTIECEEQFTTLRFLRTDEGWRFLTFLPE